MQGYSKSIFLTVSIACIAILPFAHSALLAEDDAKVETKVEGIVCLPTTIENGTCKEYFFAVDVMIYWNYSRDYCKSLEDLVGFPMDLVAIETKKEDDALIAHINQNHHGKEFWTSGFDTKHTKDFVWLSSGYALTYTNWYISEPSTNPTQDTICYHWTDSVLAWHDCIQTHNANFRPLHPLCERVR